ncbi:MAG TPA: hypothetical protein VFP84_07980 [Kofleriaceae bacterium]|nr:hypothetical protein [Kofleriaceae bacterium]
MNEIDASPGAANTAKSFAAAARMAHVGFTGTPPPDEATIIVQCAVQTGTSSWPGSCDPTGMVKALDAVGGSWVNDDVVSADSSLSVNAQVSHLTSALHTPNVVPLFGHADHWAVNYAIFEDSLTGDITEFDFFDGGPAGERDGSRTGYFNGPQFTDPTTWKSVFFKVITTVPVTDRFYNHYLNLWEPPPGFPDPRVAYTYRASPGVLGANVKPTAALARDSALRALDAAGFARHPGEWAMLSASTPTLAQEVRGVYPDGRDWDYFVVPFVNRANLVVGLVQLEHDTLRFQMATVLDNPVPLFKLSSSDALQAAQRALRAGESIGPGVLTWDPAAGSAEASSPMLPYYEFPVYRAGQPIGSQIVHSEDGRVRALTAAQMSRRLQP